MTDSSIITYIIKLSLGGIASFLAILVWAKTKDFAWGSIITGAIFAYINEVYNLISELGLIKLDFCYLFGIPLINLILMILPFVFFIIGFIIMLCRKI